MKRNFPGENKRLKKNKLFKRVLLIVIVFFFVCVFWFWKDLMGLSRWDGQRRFNMVIESAEIMLVSLDPADRSATVVTVPQNAYLTLAYGYGDYKAGSVYALGQLDPKRGGGKLLSATFSWVFGLPVDGFLVIPKSQVINMKSVGLSDFIKIVKMVSIDRAVHTNLSISEVIRFFSTYKNLRNDQVKYYNLDSYDILDNITLPDHSTVSRIDSDKLDKTLEGLFLEKDILKENISISVLNGTGEAGIATNVSRIIGNIGGKVVEVGNRSDLISERCIIESSARFMSSSTTERLSQIFGCQKKAASGSSGNSDLTLTLGKDFD